MINNVKSFLILINIFEIINYRRKLNLVFYNKYLQNKLKIDIIEFKRLSGKYLILENNGKGKEYDSYTDNLIFEGEYLNGEKLGNYKEYQDQILKLKRENIEEKRNGKVKIYDSFYEKLIFEGEFVDGKRNGKGKEYDYLNEKLIFEGEYLNDKRNGKGIEYDDGKIIFEGEFLDGKRNGKGKEYNKKGEIIFEGEYSYGKRVSN